MSASHTGSPAFGYYCGCWHSAVWCWLLCGCCVAAVWVLCGCCVGAGSVLSGARAEDVEELLIEPHTRLNPLSPRPGRPLPSCPRVTSRPHFPARIYNVANLPPPLREPPLTLRIQRPRSSEVCTVCQRNTVASGVRRARDRGVREIFSPGNSNAPRDCDKK